LFSFIQKKAKHFAFQHPESLATEAEVTQALPSPARWIPPPESHSASPVCLWCDLRLFSQLRCRHCLCMQAVGLLVETSELLKKVKKKRFKRTNSKE